MAEQGETRSPAERVVGLGKDVVVLLRDLALLALAGLLVLFPTHFNDLLVSAGFEEGSIVGFKWKAGLREYDQALHEAQANIAALRAQLDKAINVLGRARAGIGDQALASEISELQEQSRRLAVSSGEVQESVRSTIASQAALVERAQASVSTSGGWGVVFGSNVSLDTARDEIARASEKGIAKGGVYFRNGYYASIAVVDDRATAQGYLAIAKTIRPDAYVASMEAWCRSPQQRDGFVECQSTR